MAKDSPRPAYATDDRVLASLREVMTFGRREWTGGGPQEWTQLTVEKMVLEELDCESWAGVPADWMRPAIAPLLARLVAEGWAGTRRGTFERRINGDCFWRRAPLSLEEWARVAEDDPCWFPWERAVLGRDREGPHLERGHRRDNPVAPLAAELLRCSGPTRLASFLGALAARAELVCGGAPDDVAVLAGAVGRGLLRRGEERMRERGGLAFVLPPWRPDLRRHRTLLCELDARTRRAEPEPTCARELGPAVLPLPPRAPSQLAFAW